MSIVNVHPERFHQISGHFYTPQNIYLLLKQQIQVSSSSNLQ